MIDDGIFGLLLLILNFYYMITFGFLGLFFYLKLIFGIFSKKYNKDKKIKSINMLSYLSIFPSISLVLFLIFEFFDDKRSFFVYAISFNNVYDFFYGVTFIMLWFMPAIFLLIRSFITSYIFYIKFSLIWYGIIAFCFIFHIYSARMHILKIFF